MRDPDKFKQFVEFLDAELYIDLSDWQQKRLAQWFDRNASGSIEFRADQEAKREEGRRYLWGHGDGRRPKEDDEFLRSRYSRGR